MSGLENPTKKLTVLTAFQYSVVDRLEKENGTFWNNNFLSECRAIGLKKILRAEVSRRSLRTYRIKRARKLDELRKEKGAD